MLNGNICRLLQYVKTPARRVIGAAAEERRPSRICGTHPRSLLVEPVEGKGLHRQCHCGAPLGLVGVHYSCWFVARTNAMANHNRRVSSTLPDRKTLV